MHLRPRPAGIGRALWLAGLVVPIACGLPQDVSPGTLGQAVGEPQNGYPTWNERTVLVLTNRARADPAKALSECNSGCCPWAEYSATCYPPVQPLVWDYNLNRSSRFHSTFLGKGNCGLTHYSCCTLASDVGSSTCDGDPACACTAGTFACDCTACTGMQTDPFTRIGLFGTGGCAENAAAGVSDPVQVFHLWIDECASTSTCGFSSGNGHRWNILSGANTQVGVGAYVASSNCWNAFFTQDFGCGGVSIPTLVAGSHYPYSGSGPTAFTFWVNHYETSGAPQLETVVIDGECNDLALDTGTVTNGTWTANLTLPVGCHDYYFLFRDAAGSPVPYPTTGSLTVGVGAACASDYVTSQASASCTASSSDAGAAPSDAGSLDAGPGRVPALTGHCGCAAGDASVPALALLFAGVSRRRLRARIDARRWPRRRGDSFRPAGRGAIVRPPWEEPR